MSTDLQEYLPVNNTCCPVVLHNKPQKAHNAHTIIGLFETSVSEWGEF